ncbi:hypothetical protein NP493_93g00032 [Ridgeia piscesae]|uniref:Uncharacterized protein n=1 Tax=Ridgeia piscesae TaxID=27915 RepID=A0AAD9P866_RIDPI|nr:hypothetical protein NP493_93g00032 [Ridgeia piscesae]
MSEKKKDKSDGDKTKWSWFHCRLSNAHSSRLFVIVVGVSFIVLGSVLLSQYANKKLRDFLVLGIGMLVVGIAFVAFVSLFIFGDKCSSLWETVKENVPRPRSVSDSSARMVTPATIDLGPNDLYDSNGPTAWATGLPEGDPSVVLDVGQGMRVAVPRHGTTNI